MQYKTFVPGADTTAVLKLRADVWGAQHPHSTPQFLDWMTVATPAGAGSGVMMVEGADVVGFAGLLPRNVDLGDRSVTVAHCVDYMVHKRVRSRAGSFRILSLWTKLARELGYAFGIGFPNAVAHDIVTRAKLGWQDAFHPVLMARPLSQAVTPDFLARQGMTPVMRFGAALLVGFTRMRAGSALRRRPAGTAFLADAFDPRFNRLWERMRARGSSGIRRDAAYLNWRFVRHPCYSYLRVGWECDGEVTGYAIASPRDLFGVPSMLVVDLLALPDAPGVAAALLEEVAHGAREQGRPLLVALAKEDSPVRATLGRSGFLAVPRSLNPKPFVMNVHSLNEGVSAPHLPLGWYFTWGDTDVV